MNVHIQKIVKNPSPDFNRLLDALYRKKPEGRVPFYELYANIETMEKVLEKPVRDRAATVEFYYKCGYDYVPAWPHVQMKTGNLADTRLDYPIKDWKSFDEYSWPKPGEVDFSEFELLPKLLPDGMKIIAQTGGIFEAAEMLFGYESLCLMLYDDTSLVEAVFSKLAELYKEIYEGMSSVSEVGAVVISDDMGYKTQTLLKADDLRKYVLPAHKMLCDIIHKQGKPCILHSCGNLHSIMEEIIGYVGIDAKHSYEDVILPVEDAAKLYGNRIAILGGIDVDFLCRRSIEQVKARTTVLLEKLGSKGGYALGSGNSIPGYVPIENYLSMLETGWNFTC
jgi:uroporphyrinogen decarboxylase